MDEIKWFICGLTESTIFRDLMGRMAFWEMILLHARRVILRSPLPT